VKFSKETPRRMVRPL